ncbi:unnamed protein product [Rhodiola kirilowii]
METFLFTSESVNEGHPDKLCDQISDAVLDACLEQDPDSKVACETCTKTNMVMVFGEITTNADVDYEKIVRDTCPNRPEPTRTEKARKPEPKKTERTEKDRIGPKPEFSGFDRFSILEGPNPNRTEFSGFGSVFTKNRPEPTRAQP